MNSYLDNTNEPDWELLRKKLEWESGLVISSLDKWKEFCKSFDPIELKSLAQKKLNIRDHFWKKVFSLLNISETYFNRDPEQVHTIFEEVVSKRLSRLSREKNQSLLFDKFSFTAWSAGCSRGEEAYTMAIHLQALKEKRFPGMDWEVWGTDIQESSLEWARKGRYEKYSFRASFPDEWKRYWETKGGELEIHKDIVKHVHFELGNLLEPSSRKFDLVFCRNVLIYINEEKKKIILENLKNSLKPEGILVTGHSELGSFLPPDLKIHHIHKKTTYYTLTKELPKNTVTSGQIDLSLQDNISKETVIINHSPNLNSTEKKPILPAVRNREKSDETHHIKIRQFKERLYLNPDDMDAYYELSSLYWEINERKMAKTYQKRARVLIKNNPLLVDKWKEGKIWKPDWEAFLNEDL